MKTKDKLRLGLQHKGWTQKRLARVADMPEKTVSQLFNGRKRLIPLTAVKLGAALDLNAAELLKGQAVEELDLFLGKNSWLVEDVQRRAARLCPREDK